MSGDLGSAADQVHRSAETVLDFWFTEVPKEKRFVRDDALDETIGQRFGPVRAQVVAAPADWQADARTSLAGVILIDQFSRNLFRGDPLAFADDGLARTIAAHAIDRGWDEALSIVERQFLYMPFMHSESAGDQQRSIALFTALGDPDILLFAQRHADQIAEFGRFPQRNAALGRADTSAETAFLSRPGARF